MMKWMKRKKTLKKKTRKKRRIKAPPHHHHPPHHPPDHLRNHEAGHTYGGLKTFTGTWVFSTNGNARVRGSRNHTFSSMANSFNFFIIVIKFLISSEWSNQLGHITVSWRCRSWCIRINRISLASCFLRYNRWRSILVDVTSSSLDFDVTFVSPARAPRILDQPVWNIIVSTPSNNKDSMINFVVAKDTRMYYSVNACYRYIKHIKIAEKWIIFTDVTYLL